jgi:dynein heavy chain
VFEVDPLFEAQLELQVPEMVFIPSLDYGVADGFYDLVDGLVGDIYKQAFLIPRLAAHSGQENYQPDLEEMEELSDMRSELMDRINNIMNKAIEYRNSFDNYASFHISVLASALKNSKLFCKIYLSVVIIKLNTFFLTIIFV